MAFKAARNLFRELVRIPDKVKSYILQEHENLRNAFRFNRNGVDYVFDGGQIVKPSARASYERIEHNHRIQLYRYIKTLSRLLLPGNQFSQLFGKSRLSQANCATALFGAIGLAYYGSSDSSECHKLSLDDIVLCMNMANNHDLKNLPQDPIGKMPDSLRGFKLKERLGQPSSSAAVYAAEYQNNEYAIKIMFNYEYASNEYAIKKGFSKECTVLAKSENTVDHNDIGNWAHSTLPSHPNIVKVLDALVEDTPCLDDSLQSYPSALPRRLNPDGFGRNKTICLVMPKYDCTLRKYLVHEKHTDKDKMLLLAQLLEGVAHLAENYEAHRDLKTDNILLKINKSGCPDLVITDFGCCLGDRNLKLKLPFESDHVDRGGNSVLMAPEIASASPSPGGYLDYKKADVWACGAIAMEMFGNCNPFTGGFLDSTNYKDEDIELFCKDNGLVSKMLFALLKRDPKQRPSANEAAVLPVMIQYAPKAWFDGSSRVSEADVNMWLMMMWLKLLRDERLCFIRNGPTPREVERVIVVTTPNSRDLQREMPSYSFGDASWSVLELLQFYQRYLS